MNNVIVEQKRVHISSKPIIEVYDTVDMIDYNINLLKPIGLWYGFNDSWKDFGRGWLDMEEYGYEYELDVDTSKLLVVDSWDKVQYMMDRYLNIETFGSTKLEMGYIDWKRISSEYMGIEFPEYDELGMRNIFLKPKMMSYLWLHTLDVSSGCIWNSKAIRSIRKI
jgi:hypothetical protein